MANNDITVIIPTYRDSLRLKLCLEALRAQSLPQDRIEVIVANNDPRDDLAGVQLADNVRVVTVEKPGSYAARNAALALTPAPLLAFTDSDCIPGPDWLAVGSETLRTHLGCCVTGPIVVFREANASRTAFEYDFHTAFRVKEYVTKGRATTANLFVRRVDFDRVGPFNEDLLSGGDFEWNERAARNGVSIVYRSEAVIRHPARRSIRALLAKRKRVVRAEALFRQYDTAARIKYLLKPPVGVISFDRGIPTRSTRLRLFAVQYGMNLYALTQWLLAKGGLVKQTRQ